MNIPSDKTLLSREDLLDQLRSAEAELESQRGQLRDLDLSLQTRDQRIIELQQQSDEWKLAYNQLLQRAFGRRSERYIDNPDQLRLDFGNTPEAADAAEGLADALEEATQEIDAHTRKKRNARKRNEGLPAHLPRYEVTAEMPEDLKTCSTHGDRTLLPESMWDRTETLEFERPKLRVRVTLYSKFACAEDPNCGIASPERPQGIVEGDKYDPSIAAEIITNKFSYHLPLYRQQDYFASSGWVPSRGTQCNILMNCFFVITPLLDFFKKQVQQDSVVGCDDTSVTLIVPKALPELDKNHSKTARTYEVLGAAINAKQPSITAKMWAYRGQTVKLNVFDFTVSRHRDGPELFFADYRGTMMGDCWHGFESIVVASNGLMERGACNYHARRKFISSAAYPDDAKRWIAWYRQLSDIEDRGKLMSPEERLILRQAEAVPIWAMMEQDLVELPLRTHNVIAPKSDFAKALQYVRNHLTELKLYLSHGNVPFSNNDTEQLMKHVAVGRKNWLFSGSVTGGERTAGFFTLTSSAIRNDLDVWLYVQDVLKQLLRGCTDYQSFLPWNWREAHPEAVREYRVEERNQRIERQVERRDARRLSPNS
ncbi:MAG: IS66 family transposase [Planctomycetota bacterium]|nr:IS66 family transposase [Planctomycetota bacterium]MDA1177697.1 IS66 family transposase [Planctomycetota bacterium]